MRRSARRRRPLPSPSSTGTLSAAAKLPSDAPPTEHSAEFKTESGGKLPRVMKQLHHAGRSFERPTIDAAFDCEANTLVEGLEGAHQILDSARLVHCGEAHVYLHFRLRRDDIAAACPRESAPTLKLVPRSESFSECKRSVCRASSSMALAPFSGFRPACDAIP